MAKELPFFRFTASEWLNGDISLETSYHIIMSLKKEDVQNLIDQLIEIHK